MDRPFELPTDSSSTTWYLAADDVKITTKAIRDQPGPPLLEVTMTNTALDVPAFTFVMCPDDIRVACARGLQLGWVLEHLAGQVSRDGLRLAT